MARRKSKSARPSAEPLEPRVFLSNSPPTISPGVDITVAENSPAVVIPNWLQSVSPGPESESGQTVSLIGVGVNNPDLFAVSPTVDLATGDLSFTPAQNVFGSASITLAVADSEGASATSQPVNITLTPVNHPPVATDDAYTLAMGQSFSAATQPASSLHVVGQTSFFSGDTTFTGNNFSFTPSVTPDHNFVAVAYGGLFVPVSNSWTLIFSAPNGQPIAPGTYSDAALYPNQFASQPGLSVTLEGSPLNSISGSFTIHSISFNNDGSLKSLDASFHELIGTTPLDGEIRFQMPTQSGVLLNDSDADFDPMTVALVSPVSHGILALGTDGAFTYTPNSDFFGDDSFTYRDNDGAADSNVATVTFHVVRPNVAPTITPGPDETAPENFGPFIIHHWLAAISPGPDYESNQTVTLIGSYVSDPSLFSVPPTVDLTTGDLTFTPAQNASGTASVSFVVQDNGGTAFGGSDTTQSSDFTIDILHINQPPSSQDDSYNVPSGRILQSDTPGNNAIELYGHAANFTDNLVYTALNATITDTYPFGSSYIPSSAGVTVTPNTGEQISILFAAADGQPLTAGTYRYNNNGDSVQFGNVPGFSISDNTGNTTSSGTFTIHSISFNNNGGIQSLYADFQQNSINGGTLSGVVRYNFSPQPRPARQRLRRRRRPAHGARPRPAAARAGIRQP